MAAASLVAFALVVAACGGDDDDGDVAPATTTAPDPGDDGDDGDDDGDDGDTPDPTVDGDDDGGDTGTTTPAPVVTDPPEPEFEPVFGGRVVMAIEAETGNPWLPGVMTCDSSCHVRARTFYDPLVVIDSQLDWQPYLLESLEANEDDTVFTLTVRQGITFHDGSTLNADVVMDNINRTFTGILVSGAVRDVARNEDGSILMEKLDDWTFTLQTGKGGDPSQAFSWPLFPFFLAGQAGLIASSEWMAAVDAGTADQSQPVGSGPFEFVSYAPNDTLVVQRNDNYWVTDENGDALPYLDEIEFRVIQDSQVRAEALRSGDVDMLHTSDARVVQDLANDSSFNYVAQEQYGETNYLMLNLTDPVVADRNVRCALLQAIDPVELIDVVAAGAAEVSNGPFTPGQEGYLEDNGRLPFDPEAARTAVEAWEAENGPLQINITTTPTVTNLTLSQYLSAVWGDVGIDVTIDQIEQSAFIATALFGQGWQMFNWRNHAGLFVDTQYFWWHGSEANPPGELALNFGRLDDPVINELLDLARSEADPDVRRGYAEDINRRFASECLIIPTSQTRWGVHLDPAIQNLGRAPLPDGGLLRDGAGFTGQVWFQSIFLSE